MCVTWHKVIISILWKLSGTKLKFHGDSSDSWLWWTKNIFGIVCIQAIQKFASCIEIWKKEIFFPFRNYLVMCFYPSVKVECGNCTTNYVFPGSSGTSASEGIQESSHHLSQVNSSYRGTAVNLCQDWTSWSGLKQEDHQMMLSCSSAIATSPGFQSHFLPSSLTQ